MTNYKKLRKKSTAGSARQLLRWNGRRFLSTSFRNISQKCLTRRLLRTMLRKLSEFLCSTNVRNWVLSNRLPGNRRWLHVSTLSWKSSAIRSASRRKSVKKIFSKTVSVRIPAQCRRQFLQISVEKFPQSSSLIRKKIKNRYTKIFILAPKNF